MYMCAMTQWYVRDSQGVSDATFVDLFLLRDCDALVRMNESRTYHWVMAHIYMSYATFVAVSCEWIIAHMCTSTAGLRCAGTQEWVANISLSHSTHIHELCNVRGSFHNCDVLILMSESWHACACRVIHVWVQTSMYGCKHLNDTVCHGSLTCDCVVHCASHRFKDIVLCVVSYMYASVYPYHGTRMSKSCHTHESVTSHIHMTHTALLYLHNK